MREEGIVIKKEGEKAVIEIEPARECKGCGSCGAAHPRHVTVYGEDAGRVAVGDRVGMEIDSSVMLKVFSLLYGIPLVLFAGTVLLLYAMLKDPVLSFLGAMGFTIAAYILVGRHVKGKKEYSPRIVQKY